MRFFVPNASDGQQAQQLYEGARRFCEAQMQWQTTQRKIYSIRYRHDGVEYLAQVGSLDYSEGLVVCIFETAQAFLVCTPERGVLRGSPIIVGCPDCSDVEEFEN